jgi:hypothetical protein
VVFDTGGSVTIQSNALELTDLGTGSYSSVDLKAETEDNFDVQVDFDISTTPSANAWDISLLTYSDGFDDLLRMEISYESGSKKYRARYKAGGGSLNTLGTSATSDTNGKLRITRNGTLFRAYYWNGSSWTEIASGVNLTDTLYTFRLLVNSLTPGFPNTIGIFDNFKFSAGCTGLLSNTTTTTTTTSSTTTTTTA